MIGVGILVEAGLATAGGWLTSTTRTGGSATATVDVLKRWGVKKIKFVGLIGAPEGVARMQKEHPDVPIYLAAIDDHLNEKGYIVPGLGDAGDRQFGTG